jgi:hypothetical protein
MPNRFITRMTVTWFHTSPPRANSESSAAHLDQPAQQSIRLLATFGGPFWLRSRSYKAGNNYHALGRLTLLLQQRANRRFDIGKDLEVVLTGQGEPGRSSL